MTRIFISHSSHDDAFVTALAADLNAAGVQTWVDHHDILPSRIWDKEVAAALKACDTMIIVLTLDAVESDNVTDEWSYFLDEKKPVYPVKCGDCEIPFRLRRRQHVDFTGDRGAALEQSEGLERIQGFSVGAFGPH